MPSRAMLYRRPSEPQAIEVVFDQEIYLVRLRRHRQARRYTLRVQAATRDVVLTMPPRGTLREACDFARKHGGWIATRMCRLSEAAPFAPGTVLPLRGVPHRVVHRRLARGTVWTEVGSDGERLMCVAGDPPHIERRIRDFCIAKPSATSKRPRMPTPVRSAWRSSASASAIRPAAGDPARPPARSRSRGGSSSRRVTCSTISPRTKLRI